MPEIKEVISAAEASNPEYAYLSRLQFVRNVVENEGFDYAFRSYSAFPEASRTDPEFNRLRGAYVAAAEELEQYINERTTGECDDEKEEE